MSKLEKEDGAQYFLSGNYSLATPKKKILQHIATANNQTQQSIQCFTRPNQKHVKQLDEQTYALKEKLATKTSYNGNKLSKSDSSDIILVNISMCILKLIVRMNSVYEIQLLSLYAFLGMLKFFNKQCNYQVPYFCFSLFET